ncbi:MAG: sodium-dependent transporter [[Clostridium] fimetarium]|nr:sodium-dependent transporter [Alistipes timonensis]MCM1405770.1 sodium-dependent transporter [[Clostridium] fimetarium]
MADNTKFSTKLGVIAATVGSAVGLGNIWRFPYEAGMHGGGAFLLIYVIFVLLIGVPVVAGELVIGRYTGCNVAGAFKKLKAAPVWHTVAYTGLLSSLLILGFYSVVAGWTVEYIYQAVTGFGGAQTEAALHEQFDQFTASGPRQIFWTLLFLAINFFVISRGVQKGIERVSNVLMPMLFAILVVFCVNALFMPGASEGLAFLFHPDFSKIGVSTVLGALGQAFFSLSVGMGVLMTYASYFTKDTRLVSTSVTTAVLDTLVAVMAGVIIFPAVFSFGEAPAAGPRLVFEVLPSIFTTLPGGSLWALLFFILLFVAALTSTISLSEVVIAWIVGEWKLSRGKATLIYGVAVSLLSCLSAMSFGPLAGFKLFGLNFFDLLDFVSSNILLPVGGLLIALYTGWKLPARILRAQLSAPGRDPGAPTPAGVRLIIFSLRYICPLAILAIFIWGLLPH